MNTDVLELVLPRDAHLFAALQAGQAVRISGSFITGRDAAHARLCELLAQDRPLPVDLTGQTIYYTGPCPAPPGFAVGSCGPTTSERMDPYTPPLMQAGLRGMIGKGPRDAQVARAIRRYGGVYFAAAGGAGALLARTVRHTQVIAFPDLGTEAIHRFEVEGFPATVVMDACGNNLYKQGPARYRTP